jgi:DNA-binding beta-propeller fold protein YncE
MAALATAPPAGADDCPGADPGLPCPYGGVLVVGESARGVLRFPQALALSPDGRRVYVGDAQSSRVQVFARDGVWLGQFGRFGAGPGELRRVGGLATDPAGRVHVLDSDGDRVQVFTPEGAHVGAWGATGTAPGRFELGSNGGLAILGDEAYVADQNNHRVQRLALDPATGLADTDEGDVRTWGAFGACDDAAPCPPLALNRPQGIAVRATPGGAREVFVADEHHHRVVKFDGDGAPLGTAGAPGELGYPYDVAVDARGRLYVADNCDPGFAGCTWTDQGGRLDLTHQRVMAYDAGTLAFLQTWGVFGNEPGQFEYPRGLAGVAADPRGGVLVADAANNRVQAFAANGTFEGRFGISGRGPGVFIRPRAVAAAPAGELVVADTYNHRVQLLDRDGRYLGEWGRLGRTGYPYSGTAPGQFSGPAGVAVADDGTLYVADTGNGRVQARDPATGAWRVLAGGGLRRPRGIALDGEGRLVVADPVAGAVLVHDPATGGWSGVAGPFSRPQAVAVDAAGALLVADAGSDAVLRRPAGGAEWTTLGAGVLRNPGGVAVDPEGQVVVADTGGDRIVRLTADGEVRAWGARGTAAGELVAPAGLTVDRDGRVLVADERNHRVQAFAPGSTGTAAARVAPVPPARERRASGFASARR